nr:zinc finger protein 36, C3H1 type-like 3 [Ipomoea batatas]GME18572.1 zinc finger protein 36, C3H1 type-like 3 [Ipomoea batatas]
MAMPKEHKTAKTIKGDTAGGGWCPEDDGIKIVLPGKAKASTTKEDVDAHIQTVLYGPSAKRRFPVFVEFCPEN